MRTLPDGTIIPSEFGLSGGGVEDSGAYSNDLLRHGEVTDIIYPSDKRNNNGKVIEYRVEVQHYDRNKGAWITRPYDHCILSNPLAGVADRFSFTLRPKSKVIDSKTGRGLGSKVTLLCLNGEHIAPIILGGIRDEEDDTEIKDKAKDLGHHLFFNFNGIGMFIDKDGQLAVTYNGKTDADSKRNKDVKEEVTGTKLSLLKDGTFSVATRDTEQSFVINHNDHRTDLKAKKEFKIEVTDGKHKVTSQGVEFGKATDKMVLGTTYRDAETQSNNSIQQTFTNLATKLAIIGAAAQAAAAAMKVPITGPVVAAPFMDVVGQGLLQCVGDCQSAAQAIAQLEAKADTYLAKTHKLD